MPWPSSDHLRLDHWPLAEKIRDVDVQGVSELHQRTQRDVCLPKKHFRDVASSELRGIGDERERRTLFAAELLESRCETLT